MRTFIVGRAKVVASGADCIKLTAKQFDAAKVVFNIHLSQDELLDLMSQLHDECKAVRKSSQPSVKKARTVPVDKWGDDINPVVATEPVRFIATDGWKWQDIANLGPSHKINAIKACRDELSLSLKEAKDKVEEYMS